MNYKETILTILDALRTPENTKIVDIFQDEISSKDEQAIETILKNKFQDTSITESALNELLSAHIKNMLEKQSRNSEAKYPLNDMFYYGISGNCAHIHLVPKDLHDLLKKGPKYLVDTVNMYMLDAIDKLKELKINGDSKFFSIDNVYMITPMYHSPTFEKAQELEFLKHFLFKVHSYSSEQLRDEAFVKDHPEAQLAKNIFGDKKNVASGILDLKTIASEEWQSKKNMKFQEYEKKGITLSEPQEQGDR